MAEPHKLSVRTIKRMTDDQIAELVFHPRDRDGGFDFDAPEESEVAGFVAAGSFREAVYASWRATDPSTTDEQMAEKFERLYPGA
jgi:hypothetical protein